MLTVIPVIPTPPLYRVANSKTDGAMSDRIHGISLGLGQVSCRVRTVGRVGHWEWAKTRTAAGY